MPRHMNVGDQIMLTVDKARAWFRQPRFHSLTSET